MVVQMFVGLFVSQLDTNVGCSPARLWQSTERIIGLVFKFLLRKDLLLWGDLGTRFFFAMSDFLVVVVFKCFTLKTGTYKLTLCQY